MSTKFIDDIVGEISLPPFDLSDYKDALLSQAREASIDIASSAVSGAIGKIAGVASSVAAVAGPYGAAVAAGFSALSGIKSVFSSLFGSSVPAAPNIQGVDISGLVADPLKDPNTAAFSAKIISGHIEAPKSVKDTLPKAAGEDFNLLLGKKRLSDSQWRAMAYFCCYVNREFIDQWAKPFENKLPALLAWGIPRVQIREMFINWYMLQRSYAEFFTTFGACRDFDGPSCNKDIGAVPDIWAHRLSDLVFPSPNVIGEGKNRIWQYNPVPDKVVSHELAEFYGKSTQIWDATVSKKNIYVFKNKNWAFDLVALRHFVKTGTFISCGELDFTTYRNPVPLGANRNLCSMQKAARERYKKDKPQLSTDIDKRINNNLEQFKQMISYMQKDLKALARDEADALAQQKAKELAAKKAADKAKSEKQATIKSLFSAKSAITSYKAASALTGKKAGLTTAALVASAIYFIPQLF